MKPSFQQTIFGGAIINMSSRTLVRLLRFVLLIIITLRFGASHETDAFFIAQLFCFSFLLVGEALFNFSFLPVFVDYRTRKGEKEAWKLGNCTATYLSVLLLIASVMTFIFARFIASILAPGFSEDTGILTATLIRIMSIIPLLAGISAIYAVIFYSYRSFLPPSITALFDSVGAILAVLILADSIGIMSVAIGLAIGVGFRAVTLIYVSKRKSKSLTLSWDITNPGLAKVGKLSWPRFMGMSLNNLNLIVDRLLASGLGVGYVSCLTYAYRLFETPSAILLATLGRTLMPTLCEHANATTGRALQRFVSKTIRAVGFAVIPIAIMLFIVRVPLIRLLFQRGAFDVDDAYFTSSVFAFYDIGLVSLSFNLVLSGTFYALQDAMTPLRIGTVSAVLNVVLDVLLMKWLGLSGIAASTSVIAIFNTFWLFRLLSKRVDGLVVGSIAGPLFRMLLAALVMGSVVWSVQTWLSHVFGSDVQVIGLGFLFFIALVTYFIASSVLRVSEFRQLAGELQRGLFR